MAHYFKTEPSDIVVFSFGISENTVFSNPIDSRHGPFFENIFFEKFEKSLPFFEKFNLLYKLMNYVKMYQCQMVYL
jgi:hypothetical protein